MRLVWSTEEFKVGGLVQAGFPLFIDGAGAPVEPVFRFLTHHCLHRGSVQSTRTWEAYGYAFLDFLTFLERNERRWDEPQVVGQPSVLAAYRTWSRQVRDNQESTVNARLDVIVAFYEFALRHGWVSALPFDYELRATAQTNDFLKHAVAVSRVKPVADVKFRKPRKVLRILSVAEVARFLGALKNDTHRLMARFQLATGIRVDELVTFPAKYVVDPYASPEVRHFFAVRLLPRDMNTKGSVERTIHVPRDVMKALWAHKALARAARARSSRELSPVLFLTEDGMPYARSSIWQLYSEAGKKVGLHVFPHLLRHTYATHTLAALARARNIGNALLYVRNRLGHSSVKSTEIYLHYIEDVSESIMDQFQSELTQLLDRDDHA